MARTITVKGIGNITRKPDTIAISFLLATTNVDYSVTIHGAKEKLANMQNAITEAGFAKNELKTASFNVKLSITR